MAKRKSGGTSVAPGWPAEELPFIGELQAAPYDDAPRLVFADWLKERGDPRGEFIDLQCQRAKLRVRDPQYDALLVRERELLALHGATWLASYPQPITGNWGIDGAFWGFGGVGPRHHFSRGWCTALQSRSVTKFLSEPADLGVTQVRTTVQSQRDIERLATDPRFARLDALLVEGYFDLSRAWASGNIGPVSRLEMIYRDGLTAFLNGPHSHRLRWLRAGVGRSRTAETLEQILAWSGASQLDTLLTGVSSVEDMQAIGASTLRLSQLSLDPGVYFPGVFLDEVSRIAPSPALAECTHLGLMGLMGGGAAVFCALALPPRVRALQLTGSLFPTDPVQSPAFAQLEWLTIRGHVDDQLALALAKSELLAKLRILDLAGCHITEVGAQALAGDSALASLERLILSRTLVPSRAKASIRKAFRGVVEF